MGCSIACFIQRALDAAGKKDTPLSITDSFPFKDAGTIADWAIDSMKFCYKHKILQGYDNLISPLGKTTREQAIAIIKRTYDKFKVTQITDFDLLNPPLDMSLTSDVIPVGMSNLTVTSEEAKYKGRNFEEGDMFFPKYDTRLKLYVSTTSEKPNSKPSLNIISDKDSSLDFASLLLPALKPTNEKYTFTKSNVTIPRLTSSELGLYVSYDPDKAIYTDASHSAFIDKDGSNVRWFYFDMNNAPGVSKVVWQVSTAPFGGYTYNWKNPTGLVASGQVSASAKEFSINFADFADKDTVASPIVQHKKTYYVRAVPVNASGQPIGDPGEGIAVLYGKKSAAAPTQGNITPSFELWTPKETHQGRWNPEFYDPPVRLDEVGYDSEKNLPRFFHFHGIDPDVHTLIIQVSASPFPVNGGAWPETPSLVYEKEFKLPTNTFTFDHGFSNEEYPATVPVNFWDFAPSPGELKAGDCKKYYVRGITLKNTNNPGEVETAYSQPMLVNYFKREPITVIIPKVEYIKAALPEVKIKSYTPAQWEEYDYMHHYVVYRQPEWYEIKNTWKNSVTGATLAPYLLYEQSGTTLEEYTNEIIPSVLPVGAEVYFPPPKHEDKAWYEEMFDMVKAFFENLWDAITTVYQMAQEAYNGLKAAIIENLAYLCPFPELRKEFKAALELCANAGLMALGLPPTIPNMDKLINEGVDYMAEVVLTEAGIPPNEITKGMVKELAEEIGKKVAESGDHNDTNPIDSPFLKLNPKKMYRPAYIELEIKNPSTKVASVPGSVDLYVTFEMNGNSSFRLTYDTHYGEGQTDANYYEFMNYLKHFVYGLSGGIDIFNTGQTIVYDVFEPVLGWKIPSLRPGEARTVRIYLAPKEFGRQSRYPHGAYMIENDFYNMYFNNPGLNHFTLHEYYPSPVEYMQEYMKGYVDTSRADIYLYEGESISLLGPVTPRSYYTYNKIDKPVNSYWSK